MAIYSSALALLHHTYIGGGGNDQVNGVAVDIWGNIYATGFATPAVAPNFPVGQRHRPNDCQVKLGCRNNCAAQCRSAIRGQVGLHYRYSGYRGSFSAIRRKP